MMNTSIVYALDFDGVICDSAVETAITGWKAASQLWSEMPEEVPQELIDRFREVRPIIETGFEAILTMRMLFLGETVQAIYGGYTAKGKALMQQGDYERARKEEAKALGIKMGAPVFEIGEVIRNTRYRFYLPIMPCMPICPQELWKPFSSLPLVWKFIR